MQQNNCHIRVLVRGRPIDEYFMDGRYYVEGRAETDFDIEIVNNNPFSVGTMLAIDGLSVLNGEAASEDSPVYVVPANGKSIIKGWKIDSDQAASFKFTGKKGGSYVEQSTDSGANKGVIGAIFFKDKHVSYAPPINNAQLFRGFSPLNPTASPSDIPRNCWTGNLGRGTFAVNLENTHPSASLAGGSMMQSMASNNHENTSSDNMSFSDERERGITIAPVQQTLGTAFGDQTAFKTTSTAFERGDIVTKIVLFYDDSDGLRKRGIVLNRPSKSAYRTVPNPFPGSTGCLPPADWRG